MKHFEQTLIQEAEKIKSKKTLQTDGAVTWTSPSNIAIVKYWGKRPGQIPANSSVSMTLSEAHTKTKIDFNYLESRSETELEFLFERKSHTDFRQRIEKYLMGISTFLPWIKHCKLKIESENTFPHSSGIASSASAMSALSVALCDIEEILFGETLASDFHKKASFLARLGSGSASRSVYGKMAVWGATACRKDASDEFAIPVEEIHEHFLGMRDSILIIESGKKQISSSLGHDLMKSNPYARLRFEAAEENMQRLCSVIRNGDIGHFIDIMENEALSLHAMMMTSTPGYLLMKPNTLAAVEAIRKHRLNTGLGIGFTLDAGANLHILYPEKQAEEIFSFIESELKQYCFEGQIIHDKMGAGPIKIS